MAQTPNKDAEAGTTTQKTPTKDKEIQVKTVSSRVFTDFAAI